MKYYVVSFIFTLDYEKVWLIRKNKPEWQKGCLNGIGGKVEEFEEYNEAAKRELEEEGGISIPLNALKEVGYLQVSGEVECKVVIFTGACSLNMHTMEEEEIFLIALDNLKSYPHIDNIPTLVEACLYKNKINSSIDTLIIEEHRP